MSIELKMPALSPTIEKGTLAKWLVAVGDVVKAGDLIAEIETDKATMEFEAVDEGRIARLLVDEGTDDVPVGTVIAVLSDSDASDVAEPSNPALAPAPVPVPAPTPAAPAPAAAAQPAARAEPSSPPEKIAPAVVDALVARRQSPADRVRVSPLAARIAEAKGIDLGGISGTGPNGRIVRADLGLKPAVPVPAAPTQSRPVAVAPPPEGVPVETVKLSAMRKTIARRLGESKQNIPHFYLMARCNLDAILRLRGELNASLADRGVKLSVNDFMMKALALALVEVPDANVQFGEDVLHRFRRVDVSMAVAIEGGLVTPVLRGVEALSLSAIAKLSKELAAKARDGKLMPEDYQGGTVSISNLGMFGIDEMAPVINPPQAVILGIGAGIEQPWQVDGAIGLATIMAATASFDHRAIDGAAAARFMAAFRDLVETPLTILG